MALAAFSIEESEVISSWIGLTFTGTPMDETASSPLETSRQPRRIWKSGRVVARDLTISKPMPGWVISWEFYSSMSENVL